MSSRKSGRMREIGAGILIVLACLTFLVATPAIWARRNFLDTDRFVSRAAPLVHDPSVQTALTNRLTTEIMNVVNPEKLFREVLPERGQILAAPLSSALEGFVHDQVETFVQSDAFAKLWDIALRKAHETAVGVLRGDTSVLETKDGIVKLNLVPIIDAVLAAINSATPDVLGRDIQIPSVEDATSDPNSAVSKLADALGVKLDSDFGQIVVYDRGQLSAAQEGVELFDRFVVLTAVLTLVFAAGALLLTRHRRRTLIWLAVGVILGMVLLRRASFRLADDVSALPPTEAGQGAAASVMSAYVDPLTTFALWAALGALVVLVVAVLTSNQPRVVSLRERTVVLAKRVIAKPAEGEERTRPVWVDEHYDLVRAGGVIVGLLLLWFFDLSWLGVLLVIALVVGFEVALHRMAPLVPEDANTPIDVTDDSKAPKVGSPS